MGSGAREVEEAVIKARGWHEWLFRLSLKQARAELALACADWPEAATLATTALQQSRTVARGKYEAAALAVRAQALQELGQTREAMRDAKAACTTARRVGDPALQVRILGGLLPLTGDDKLRDETRGIIGKILAALPNGTRRAFEEAPIVDAVLTGRTVS